MLKKLLVLLSLCCAALAYAAVDVNQASEAELDGIKGIGPSISGKILDERKKGAYKDWPDLIERVKGVGEGNAAKFSAEGLTVNGGSYNGAPAATTKKEPKAKKAKADKAAADTSADAVAEPASTSSKKKSKKDKKDKAASQAQ